MHKCIVRIVADTTLDTAQVSRSCVAMLSPNREKLHLGSNLKKRKTKSNINNIILKAKMFDFNVFRICFKSKIIYWGEFSIFRVDNKHLNHESSVEKLLRRRRDRSLEEIILKRIISYYRLEESNEIKIGR